MEHVEYFLPKSLLGQALGLFLAAYGSQKMFTGPAALATSFALWTGLFGLGTIVAVEVLRRRLHAAALPTTVPTATP